MGHRWHLKNGSRRGAAAEHHQPPRVDGALNPHHGEACAEHSRATLPRRLIPLEHRGVVRGPLLGTGADEPPLGRDRRVRPRQRRADPLPSLSSAPHGRRGQRPIHGHDAALLERFPPALIALPRVGWLRRAARLMGARPHQPALAWARSGHDAVSRAFRRAQSS